MVWDILKVLGIIGGFLAVVVAYALCVAASRNARQLDDG